MRRSSGPYFESIPALLRQRGLGLLLVLAVPVVLIFALLFLITGDDDGDTLVQTEDSFYLEGDFFVLGPAPAPGADRPEISTATLRWWYASPTFWRWEIDTTDKETGEITNQMGIADGQAVWVYDGVLNVFYRFLRGDRENGALPLRTPIGDVDTVSLVEKLQGEGAVVHNGGANRHIGRDAEVIEYSPIVPLTAADGARSPGIGRLWVDNESGLVLRATLDEGTAGDYMEARLTAIDLAPRLERDLFRWEPPAGATQVQPTAQ